MDLPRVLELVRGFLDGRGYRHAVAGGIALAALGSPRATYDLDLVVDAAAQSDLIAELERLGYETLHRSSGFSNHLHRDRALGHLDFVYVRDTTADALFGEAVERLGPGGTRIRVPRPEHLAAMKLQAMKDDPTRTFQEMADIRFLLTLPGIDRDDVRQRFARAGWEARFDELEASL